MTEIRFGRDFLRSVEKIPRTAQGKLDTLLQVLSENPFDHRLHTKALVGNLEGYYSFRITRDWRVIFIFLSQASIEVLRVKHRKDAYR